MRAPGLVWLRDAAANSLPAQFTFVCISTESIIL